MVSIQVIYESSGKPAANQRVNIGWEGFFRGMSGERWTDQRGEAHFEEADPGCGKVYINGRTVFSGQVEGRVVIYI